ncbi:LPS export ABC transporter periplasmic protein LptC [candidate division KSB1 bacterium]|nr:LPS export ABC transporter periplasmic protein LptC [candidate division KSB1 bacterium]
MLSVVLYSLLSVSSCREEKTPIADAEPQENLAVPNQEGWNSIVRATRKGRVEAVVRYGHMLRYSDQETIFFDQGIFVYFYNAQGKAASRLTAEAGEMNEGAKWVKAIGNVVVQSDTGITVYTEELLYDQKRELILSQSEVKITTAKGDTLFGQGLESDPQMIHYRILKPRARAHTGLNLENQERPTARAAGDSAAEIKPDSAGTGQS